MTRARMYLILISALLALTFLPAIASADARYATLAAASHPRLILSREMLSRIREDVRAKSAGDYRELLAYARWRLQSTTPGSVAGTYFQPEVILPLSLAALISSDPQLVAYATECIVQLAERAAESGDDTVQRQRLMSLALGYDWLYAHLSPLRRAKVVGGISRHLRLLGYLADSPKFTGGHYRFGNAVLLAGAMAIAGETGAEENELLLERLCSQWTEGYNPFQSFAARGGGYVMGWQYGAGYTSLWPYLFGERLGFDWIDSDWLRQLPLWYIYGLRGDGAFPRMGDCNDCRVGQHLALTMAHASTRWSDGRAEWFYRTRLGSLWGPYRIWRIIFPGAAKGDSPDSPDGALPPARHFPGSGVVLARDAWDETSTHLVFKSSPYYSINHQHKDQNHFELSFKGSLLVDSGCYDRYGSSHWQNYYTRTIAHNSLVVFSEGEKYILNGKELSNDGGQIFRSITESPRGEEPVDLAEALADKYRLDGVTGFSGSSVGAWMRGDASKAYDSRIVKSYLRDIVMLYRPLDRKRPLLLILDRVTLGNKLMPRILFHSNEKPVATGRRFTLANSGGGIIHGEFFGSVDPRVNVIGGPGQEWLVNDVNYTPESVCGRNDGTDPGNWRLEVGSAKPVHAMELLTVLAVDDAAGAEGEPHAVQVSGEGYRGVISGKDLVIIAYGAATSEWTFEGSQFDGVERVVLAGTVGGQNVRINGRDVVVEPFSSD